MNIDYKRATTVVEQINKLRLRGMIIENEEKAKETLLDIGYFRLGFYWFPFEKTYPSKTERNHLFKDGTYLEDAVKLYYFDFDLRNLLLRYISRIEINFRTTLIYLVSNKYSDNPFWYVDIAHVNKTFVDSSSYQKAIADANKENVVKNDLRKYHRKHAPSWKVLEFMSFGTIILLYENLMDGGLQNHIAKYYGFTSANQFSNYLNTIRRLRNCCAHGKVLFDLKLPVAISKGPLGYLGNRKTMLSGAYEVLSFLLGKVSENRKKEMDEDLIKAFKKVNSSKIEQIIINTSGFTKEKLNF